MDENLKWLLELRDQFTGPADAAGKSLVRLTKKLADGSRATVQFGRDQTKAAAEQRKVAMHSAKLAEQQARTHERAARRQLISMRLQRAQAQEQRRNPPQGVFSEGLKGMGADLGGWLQLAERAAGIVMGFGKGIYDAFAFGVGSAAYRESSEIVFGVMEKSVEGGKALYDQAVRMALDTPFQIEEVVNAFKQLRGAGFSAAEVPEMFKGLGDIAAASGFEGGIMDRIVAQLADVKSNGTLLYQDYKVLAGQMGRAGVGRAQLNAALAKALNIDESEVMGVMSERGISAAVGIKAIMDAISERFGGLGVLTEKMGKTTGGLLEKIKDIPKAWFLVGEDVNAGPGMTAFKEGLKNIDKLFDVTTKSGKRIQEVVLGIFNSGLKNMFGDLTGEKGLAEMEKTVMGLLEGVKMLWAVIASSGEAMKGFAEGIKPALGALGDEKMWDPNNPAAFAAAMRSLGKEIGTIAGEIVMLVRALSSLVSLVSGKTGDKGRGFGGMVLDSAVTAGFGGTGGGFINLLRPFIPSLVPSAPPAPVLPPTPPTTTAPGALASVGKSYAPTVNLGVSVDNTGHQDSEEIARRLGDSLPGQLAAILDQMSMETGAA